MKWYKDWIMWRNILITCALPQIALIIAIIALLNS